MTRRVYAEDTKVPVAQSRASIEAELKKVGATRIVTMDEPLEAIVAFNLDLRLIKLQPDAPTEERRAD